MALSRVRAIGRLSCLMAAAINVPGVKRSELTELSPKHLPVSPGLQRPQFVVERDEAIFIYYSNIF
ncbi:hypothetical protein GGD66_008012 [Bradyrhizobium sp. CIR48]|uniref:hypothetical protein n=1 Tax=unclassified Bradyrhizobium TaxID=2631580 RepID=UPI001605C2B4|nr:MULTISPECIES: hypothetical protein [unclassified Bradyrhizobium]MBB4366907.1 hypothetical protein [Bradyrhizobium sp. CIR18]MBB4429410.1 hypothetical protein [Bradyrhizobium sp. CIR48]